MPSKTIDETLGYLIESDSEDPQDKEYWELLNRTKRQLLQDLTEMSETTHVFPKGFKPGDEPVEKKSVPFSRLKQYLNIEGDDEKAKE